MVAPLEMDPETVEMIPVICTGRPPGRPVGAPPEKRAGVRTRRLALRLTVAAVVVLGSALPAPAAERGPVKSLLEMRRENVVVQDFDLSCGAAALATLLNYQHGESLTEREVTYGLIQREEYLEAPEIVQLRQGFSLLDLKRFADGLGYEGIGYGQLELENLIEFAPIMVPVNFNGYNHFVVFRGVVGADRVLLADPAWGNRTMPRERFERSWLEYPEFGKVGFRVARRDGAEPPNRLAPFELAVPAPPDAVLRRAVVAMRP
jgi:uncharacterized protein